MTPIVVVAFNRPKSLTRLLKSLAKAKYPPGEIILIISIDASKDNQNVLKISEEFLWIHGEKKIVYQSENLGLRKHILKCGDYSVKYGAAIILEDDLFVSPNFYNYTTAALSFSLNKNYIGGISLYNHQINVHTGDNFSAREDGFDNWYFQFASSWGQAWTSHQWKSFREWYKNKESLKTHSKIPQNVTSWSDKSWLKYFIGYLIEKKRYFLYPKISLSTNFSDAGTHIGNDSTKFQVPILFSEKKVWQFSTLERSGCVYDSFYENENLHNYVNFKRSDLAIDLHGHKPITEERYLLTNKILNYKIIRTFGKSLKPIDTNIIENIDGYDFFLYDKKFVTKNILKKNKRRDIVYNIKGLTYKKAVYLAIDLTKERIKAIINK